LSENCRTISRIRWNFLGSGLYHREFPVRGSGSQTPPIASRRIQANPNGPKPAAPARRKNTRDSRGRGFAARQIIDTNAGAWFQGAGGTEAAAARIYQQGMAQLGESLGLIETGHPQRDLRTNSRSVAPLHRECVVTD
jgi:hypothetical protein